MGVQTTLDAVASAPSIVDAMRLADDLAFEAGRDPGVRTVRLLRGALRGDDELVTIAAVHALAEVFDGEAGTLLVSLLSDERSFVREHAAWALASGLPRIEAMARLLGLVIGGGFTGMIAQSTLERWSGAMPEALFVGIESALLGEADPEARARLVETLGLVRDSFATDPLVRIAADERESEPVRIAAVAALGQRPGAPRAEQVLRELADGGSFLAEVARLSLIDLAPVDRDASSRDGLSIAQLFLHADIDPHLSSAGAGDNGGIATLLVRLGNALAADGQTGVRRVITLSRGSIGEAGSDLQTIRALAEGHVYGHIPLLRAPMSSAAAWPLRVVTRRGIRRILRAAGGVDVLHLRMADVGALAAADVARELGIPVVFTVAPDPHAVIESMDRSGALTRAGFGWIDLTEHFWFRTRLVQRLAANSSHTVFFPRARLTEDMRRLVGIDMNAHAERHTIVPEGVDLATVDDAVAEARMVAGGGTAAPAFADLRAMIDELPVERRGLPLVMSVGRLHRVKGMASLVAAWANGPASRHANLLIVGGDLEHPSVDEREQLDMIARVVPEGERAQRGLLLPGHRSNDIVARWMAATRVGLPGANTAGGVYVCASIKEEFGIALLEAMASGLFVVAPDGGGPATYIENGVTGILTETWNVAALGTATDAAILAAQSETDTARAERGRAMVAERFTIEQMSSALGEVYRTVAREEEALVDLAGSLS